MWWSRFWTAGNCELLILSILWPSVVPTLRDTDETVGHNRGCVDLLGCSRGNIFHLAWMAVQVWQRRFGSAGLAAQLVNTGDNVAVLATWSPGFALQAPPFNYC